MMNFQIQQSPYTHIWHKYRPVILRLMIDAEGSQQHYAFSAHEFKRIFPKNRSSLAFTLCIHRSRALSNIKASPLAQALLAILNESKTAGRLAEASTYEFVLDDKFILHVRRNDIATNKEYMESKIDERVSSPTLSS